MLAKTPQFIVIAAQNLACSLVHAVMVNHVLHVFYGLVELILVKISPLVQPLGKLTQVANGIFIALLFMAAGSIIGAPIRPAIGPGRPCRGCG